MNKDEDLRSEPLLLSAILVDRTEGAEWEPHGCVFKNPADAKAYAKHNNFYSYEVIQVRLVRPTFKLLDI